MKKILAWVFGLLLSAPVTADLVTINITVSDSSFKFYFNDSDGAIPDWDGYYYIGRLQAPKFNFDGNVRLLLKDKNSFYISQPSGCGLFLPNCFLKGVWAQNGVATLSDPRVKNMLGNYFSEYLGELSALPNSGIVLMYNPSYLNGSIGMYDSSQIIASRYTVTDTSVGADNTVPEPPASALMITCLFLICAVVGRPTRLLRKGRSLRGKQSFTHNTRNRACEFVRAVCNSQVTVS